MRRRGEVLAAMASLLACLAAAPVTAAAAERVGAIVGQVVDRQSGRALAGAEVLLDAREERVVSDEAGRFTVTGLPVGTYRLLVSCPGYATARELDVPVNVGRDTSVEIALVEMPALHEEVDVTVSAFQRPPDLPNSVQSMSYDEIRRAPGALGDIGRMVQSLPGVVSVQDERNDIVARGGNPIESVIAVDGFEVPNLNHFAAQGASGGAISMLSPENISGATFIAGGMPSYHGNRLSSALEVTLREGDRRRFQAEADVSMGGAGVIVEGPLGSRGSWLGTARRSYLDLVAGAFGESAVPNYSNYLVKGAYDLGHWGRINLLSLGGWDSYDQTGHVPDAEEPDPDTVDMSAWRNVTGLSLQTYLGSRGALTLNASYARSGYSVDGLERALGVITTRNRSTEGELGVRGELVYALRPQLGLRAGVGLKRLDGDYQLDQPIGWYDEYSTDPRRVNAYSTDIAVGTNIGSAWAQLTFQPHRRLDLTLGGRVDHYASADAWKTTPRASFALHLTPKLDFSGTYGRYTQMPPLALVLGLPENHGLLPMRAGHAILGLTYTPGSDLRLSVEAYDKRYHDYPVSAESPFLSLANMAGYYDINEILMPMVSRGSGRARGIEFSLRKKLSRSFYGQLNYARSRSEHRALDGVLRYGGYDLPDVLSAILGVRLGERWEFSGKFAYSSGRPMTPVLEAESAEQERNIMDPARLFEERGPAYHRLDLRGDRRFHRKWGTVMLYVEADNVYDRENVLRYEWNPDTRRMAAEKQLSLLVLGGLTVQF